MKKFLEKEKSFQPVYNCAIMMLRDRKGMIAYMTSFFEEEDIVASLNATNASIIKRLTKELAEKDEKLQEKDNQLQELDNQLQKRDRIIEKLRNNN